MTKQKILAGIDIGSSKTTTIIASPSEEESVKVMGVASVPSRGIRKGQIINIEEATETVIEAVEAAERMAGYGLNRVLVSISGPQIASQNSKGVVAVAEPEGEIEEEDVRRVIEAAQALSFPSSREAVHILPRYFTVDGQEGIKDPIGMSGVRLEVETHIITASSTAIKNLIKCVSEIGAEIQDLVVAGLASAEAVLTETEKELGVVLVDIGGGVTDVVVFVEGSPFYTSVLPVGAKNVTNDLAIGLRVSLEAAEKIKLFLSQGQSSKVSSSSSKEEKDEVELSSLGITKEKRTVSKKTLIEGIIRPRLNEIFELVNMEIKKGGAVGLTPAGVVICGGGAQTVGVVQSARQTLSLPVRVGVPQGITGLIDEIQTPEFATVVGLIFYGARKSEETTARFLWSKIGERIQKVPIRGMAGKIIEIIKSLLP